MDLFAMAFRLGLVLRLASIDGYAPKIGSIPGVGSIVDFANEFGMFVIAGCLIGILAGALLIAIGKSTNNGIVGGLGVAFIFGPLIAAFIAVNAGGIINGVLKMPAIH